MRRICLSLAQAVAVFVVASSPSRADFSSCAPSLRSEAAHQGVPGAILDSAFGGLQPDMKVLEFQREQPEFKTPIWDYLASLVDEERVSDGKARMAQYASALATAEQRFGVSRYVLAAFWGVESDYGRAMGKRPLVQSLSTLACLGQRPDYFRRELMAALKIIASGDVAADQLNGSWAGAFGQTQFMPSEFERLAVDLDGDGRRDIVGSAPDALGSTANYLRKSGWRPGLAWGFEVRLPAG